MCECLCADRVLCVHGQEWGSWVMQFPVLGEASTGNFTRQNWMALLSATTRGCSFSTSSPASVFLTEAIPILMGVGWNFKVAIVCVSVVAKDVEHLKKIFID